MTTALLACLYLLPIVAVFAVMAWVADRIEVIEVRRKSNEPVRREAVVGDRAQPAQRAAGRLVGR